MNRKAVFFDIDGTLYENGKPIRKSTIEAIRKIRENGHLAFLCSGRGRIMITITPAYEIGFDGVVAACGCYGECNGKVLFEHELTKEQVEEMISVFTDYETMFLLEGTGHVYYNDELCADTSDDWYIQYVKESIPKQFIPVKDADEIRVCKASIHARHSETIEELYDHFRDRYDILEHTFDIAELVPKGHSKATGIAEVCEKLGIAREDTIAVGDSVNDVDMLKYAGVGVVMGNGTKPAMDVADFVTKPIDEDGIYYAMEHLGLL